MPMFVQNFTMINGGTVFLRNHSNVIFDNNSMATFSDNEATYGDAIYCEVGLRQICWHNKKHNGPGADPGFLKGGSKLSRCISQVGNAPRSYTVFCFKHQIHA